MDAIFHPIESPVGRLFLVADATALRAVLFESVWSAQGSYVALTLGETPVSREAAGQLSAYFRGERTAFDLPLAGAGTDFQKQVWAAVARIPFGSTRSYRDLAAELGAPGAVRAVGRTNAVNPLCVVVPCHRVVGADGSLTGYAGGLAAKRWLLRHEGALPAELIED